MQIGILFQKRYGITSRLIQKLIKDFLEFICKCTVTFFPSQCGYGWIPDKNGVQHFFGCSALAKTSLTEFSSSLGYAWRQPYLSLKSHKMSEKEHGIGKKKRKTGEYFTTSRQSSVYNSAQFSQVVVKSMGQSQPKSQPYIFIPF